MLLMRIYALMRCVSITNTDNFFHVFSLSILKNRIQRLFVATSSYILTSLEAETSYVHDNNKFKLHTMKVSY
jgi:hypothetical protein